MWTFTDQFCICFIFVLNSMFYFLWFNFNLSVFGFESWMCICMCLSPPLLCKNSVQSSWMRLWLHLLAQYLVVCYQLSKKGITFLKLFDPGIIPSKVPSLSALQRSVTTAELQPCWLVSGECGPWAQVLRNPWGFLFLYHICSRSNKELWLAHLSEDASRWMDHGCS